MELEKSEPLVETIKGLPETIKDLPGKIISRIKRIGWKKLIINNLTRVLFFVVACLLLGSIALSTDLDLDSLSGGFNTQYALLIIVSSLCFLIVIGVLIKVFIFDNAETLSLKDDLGKYRRWRTFLFIILLFSFSGAIYLLLDVVLYQSYLILGPVVTVRFLYDTMGWQIFGYTHLQGLFFYVATRNVFFSFFFAALLVFPIIALLTILTSIGRHKITARKKVKEPSELMSKLNRAFNILLFTLISIITFSILFIIFYFSFSIQSFIIIPITLFGTLLISIFIFGVIKLLLLLILKSVKFTTFVSYVNILLISPIIIVFWVAPILFWVFYDLVQLAVVGSLVSFEDLLLSIASIVSSRTFDLESIILLDFVIITSIATVVIGLAEGLSILAIFFAIRHAINITRLGEEITTLEPTLIPTTLIPKTMLNQKLPDAVLFLNYLFLSFIWVGIFWTSFGHLWVNLKEFFYLNLPPFPFPSLLLWINTALEPIQEVLAQTFPVLLPLVSLIIPLYFILSASFRFLSVTIVTKRWQGLDYFLLFVSTAFTLIIIHILGDIYYMNLADAPLVFLTQQELLNFAVNLLRILEALFFFVGVIFGVYMVIKQFSETSKEKPLVTPKIDEFLENNPK